MWQIWLIIAGIFFVMEMMTVGFLVFWFGIGALLTSLVSVFTDSIIIQTAVFVISSTLLLFLTKPLVKKLSHGSKVQTNAYSIIGKTAIVTKQINDKKGTGQVKVGSEIWSAKSSFEIPEGTEVVIKEIDGVKVIVEPVAEPVLK